MATGIGWLSLAGVALIVVGVTLLLLVDAPRRILGFLRHGHSPTTPEPPRQGTSDPSGPERAVHTPEPGALWVTPPAESPRPAAPLWAREDPRR
jgi:hypothetical protein